MSDVALHPRILSLCSGIGGLDLGIGLALPGARAVCFVEREYPVCEVLAARMEQGAIERAPIHTDLRAFDGRPWRGRVDIVAAGYPCQPFSVAGKRRGEEDERHLWPDVLRIIGEVGPSLVFLENVAGHLRLGFDRVLGDLADLGLDAEWSLVRASDVGAPHRRERLFVLAYRDNDGRVEGWQGGGLRGVEEGSRQARGEGREQALPPERGEQQVGSSMADSAEPRLALARPRGERKPQAEEGQRLDRGSQLEGGELADPGGMCTAGRRGPGGLDSAARAAEGEEEERQRSGPTPDDCGRGIHGQWPPGPDADWQAVPEDLWPATQPSVRGVADGLPGRVDRLRALGNAVVPQQAAHAFRGLLMRAFSNSPTPQNDD